MIHAEKKQRRTQSPSSFFPPTPSSSPSPTIHRLLELVVEGKTSEVKALIQQQPELLLQKGDITDPTSEVLLKDVTAFQVAVWRRDLSMWRTIWEKLYGQHPYEAAEQYLPFMDSGRGLGENGQRSPAVDETVEMIQLHAETTLLIYKLPPRTPAALATGFKVVATGGEMNSEREQLAPGNNQP